MDVHTARSGDFRAVAMLRFAIAENRFPGLKPHQNDKFRFFPILFHDNSPPPLP
jgi:hypothetical protein